LASSKSLSGPTALLFLIKSSSEMKKTSISPYFALILFFQAGRNSIPAQAVMMSILTG
jgi:hypothetical protein